MQSSFKMTRRQYQEFVADVQNQQKNSKNRGPKRKSGLRPFRKDVQSYVDWVKDMGVTDV